MWLEWIERLFGVPIITKKDIWIIVVAASLWYVIFQLRPQILAAVCIEHPEKCQITHLMRPDRINVGVRNHEASIRSNVTQYASAYLAFLIPALLMFWRAYFDQSNRKKYFGFIFTDLFLGAQTICINGFLNELVKVIVRRPRPFVFGNAEAALNPAHYTSFYSGHTSFAAAANVFLFFTLIARRAPWWLILLSGMSGFLLTMLTAYFRVFAGVHFITDVLAGAVAGSLVAFAVAIAHRKDERYFEGILL